MRRMMPQTLGGQLLAMLLLALAVTQGLGVWLLTDERNRAVRAALKSEAAGRAANIALLLEVAPDDLHAPILRAAGSPLVRFEVSPAPEVARNDPGGAAVLRQIERIMGDPARDVRVDVETRSDTSMGMPMGGAMRMTDRMQDMRDAMMTDRMRDMRDAMMGGRRDTVEMSVSIPLATGDWLNLRTQFRQPGLQVSARALVPLLLMGVAVILVVWWVARRVVGPMRALAEGADRLGRGEDTASLAATGPKELRETTRAFNQMQDRLTRFVAERTRMLAALSHDLRSPLTAMRLRVETLDETEDSDRLRTLIAEMQAMVEATLDFARNAAQAEPATPVDLAALLADLAGDAGDDKVTLVPSAPVRIMARAPSLRRALRNLIDNAVGYGGSATIALEQDAGAAVVTIADRGPGLPDDQLEAVFAPFARHEPSRSRDTGGTGLGLAIARTILQAHGGTVTLRNLPEGGLQARVQLPIDAAQA